MEDELKNLIETAINIPCYLEGDSITFPGATVAVSSDSPRLIGDGAAASIVHTAYINLWYVSRSDRDTATASLVEALQGYRNSTPPDIERYYDTTAKKHRAVINFEFI